MERPEDLGHLPPASSLGLVTSPGGSSVGTGKTPHQQQVGPPGSKDMGTLQAQHCSDGLCGCPACSTAVIMGPRVAWSTLSRGQLSHHRAPGPESTRLLSRRHGRGLRVNGGLGFGFFYRCPDGPTAARPHVIYSLPVSSGYICHRWFLSLLFGSFLTQPPSHSHTDLLLP